VRADGGKIRTDEGKSRLVGQVYRPIVCDRCGAARPNVVCTTPALRRYYCQACDHEFKVPVAQPG
jgi:hypothetical protein